MTLVSLLIGVLAAYMAVMTGLTGLFWWYETINTGHVETLRRGWGLSPGQALGRMLRSSLRSQLLAFMLYPFGFIPFIHTSNGPAQRPPVLFVHGLYHNAGAWLPFRRRLAALGFTRTAAFTYCSFATNYAALLDRLAREVARLQTRYPGQGLLLVGHSLGGLLIRGYLSSPQGQAAPILAAVTLGSPHAGSRLAALGIGRLAQSLRYRGPLIRELEARDRPPACPVLALTTPLDNFVLPADGSDIALPGWTQEAGPLLAHVDMLYDRELTLRVAEFLGQASGKTASPRS